VGRLAVGSAPDSWGVWFANDEQQTPWERFLDEVGEVVEPRLDRQGQARHGRQVTEPGRRIAAEYGLKTQFHPHADGHVEALSALDADLFAIVEQDMYPCPPDVPLPIAERTLAYLRTHGGGVSVGRPAE